MTTEFQREQQERREVLRNDARLREQEQASTMHQHAQAQLNDTGGGRFGAINTPHHIGSTEVPKYPELPADSPFHHDPVPDEPPLSVDEMKPSGTE
jgi:hypothetical protein